MIWRRLTTARCAGLILFLLLFAMALRVSDDSDVWWHLRLGQDFSQSGQAIYADAWSFTAAGQLHYNHSALSQLLLRAAWDLAGHAGLSLFTAFAALAGMAFVYLTCVGGVYPRAFLMVAGAAAAAVFWSPRPQMFTFVMAAALLWLLHGCQRGHDRSLWIAPLMWLWGWLHGGFVLGYALIAAVVVGDLLNRLAGAGERHLPRKTIRRIIMATLASLPLMIVNPLSLDVFAAPLNTIGDAQLGRFIQEWQAPDLRQPDAWPFVALLALLIASALWSRRRFDFGEWLLLAGTALMAMNAARHISLFAVAALPVVSFHLDAIFRRKGWRIPSRQIETAPRLALNLLLLLGVATGLALHLLHVTDARTIDEALSRRLPVAAVRRLHALKLQGRMFNSYDWGGYLIFHARRHPVFIDGRSDLYAPAGLLDMYYQMATASDGWRAALDGWRIDFALIETEGRLARALHASPDWETVHSDPLASIFRRKRSIDDG